MSEHAGEMQLAFRVTPAGSRFGPSNARSPLREFVVTGIVVSYAVAVAPIVAGYLMIKGHV